MKDFWSELKNPWLAFALACMIGLIVLLYNIPIARAHQPNLDGRTLVWPIGGWGGVTIRRFMPGPPLT